MQHLFIVGVTLIGFALEIFGIEEQVLHVLKLVTYTVRVFVYCTTFFFYCLVCVIFRFQCKCPRSKYVSVYQRRPEGRFHQTSDKYEYQREYK